MYQSEEIMQEIKFSRFRVDMDGFEKFVSEHKKDFNSATEKCKELGLENFNSPRGTKQWLESMGIDCSRGAGKEVYLNPVNVSTYPEEMNALAKARELETLRRKIETFRKTLV